uniref:Uncharacterized protein n=1 Tax=Cacopsylla melanoneura TaxID=428564 RepID=A0A8D8V495_9HEMI
MFLHHSTAAVQSGRVPKPSVRVCQGELARALETERLARETLGVPSELPGEICARRHTGSIGHVHLSKPTRLFRQRLPPLPARVRHCHSPLSGATPRDQVPGNPVGTSRLSVQVP